LTYRAKREQEAGLRIICRCLRARARVRTCVCVPFRILNQLADFYDT